MKKIFKIVSPSILMFILVYLMRGGKDILEGLFFFFPIIYILLGIFYSSAKTEWVLSVILISLAFIIPINIYYNMGSCIEWVLIYIVLSVIGYFLKNLFLKNNKTKY